MSPVRRPTSRDISRGVQGGLGLRGGLTAAQLTYLEFEPTIGITAARLNKLAGELNDFKDILQECIREVIIPSIRTNFQSGGRPPWPPLSENTVEFRAMFDMDPGKGLLIRSGALMSTMGQATLWTVTRDFAILKDLPDSVWYGKVHQAGYGGQTSRPGLRGAAPIPARPFVMFQPEDEDEIMERFIKWLGEKVDEAWPGGFDG